jgi:hypothetical protein
MEMSNEPHRSQHRSQHLPPPLEGSLSVLSLADVVQLLSTCSCSGSLEIVSEAGTGSICFYRGRITAACSPRHPPLAIVPPARRPRRRGRSFFLDPEPTLVEPAPDRVVEQIHRAFREIVSWSEGRYRLRSVGGDPRAMSACDHPRQIDVRSMLMATAFASAA